MKKAIVIVLVLLALAVAVVVTVGRRVDEAPARLLKVATGELTVWSTYQGQLEARRVHTIMSQYHGSSAIVALAPEGASVKQGDVIARFDASQVEQDLVKLEYDAAMSEAELNGLQSAELPMELDDLQNQLAEARYDCEMEQQYLEDSRELVARDLVSEQEVKQQELKVAGLRAKLERLEKRLALTREHLHPSRLARASAAVASVKRQLAVARAQLACCTLTAPADGVAVYRPLHIGGEFRTVRVGDTVFKNQPFMAISDMSDLVVHGYIPESDLSRVQPGFAAVVAPVAYPDMRLSGEVESVGAMAQARPGFPHWQKYFHVIVGLAENDARLRTGISVTVNIVSYHRPEAVLIPRPAVWWRQGRPQCTVRSGDVAETRALELGQADEVSFEVLGGVQPDETVVVP